jgi:hypothetical protein
MEPLDCRRQQGELVLSTFCQGPINILKCLNMHVVFVFPLRQVCVKIKVAYVHSPL